MEIPPPIRKEVEAKGGLEGIAEMVPEQGHMLSSSKMYKALSDPLRLRILYILSIQPLCVCCIKELVDISDSKLSYHLSRLREAGLIQGEQRKNWIIYSLTQRAENALRESKVVE